ncbi:MAG: DNA-directed DNA polymerase [Candidatus Anstonellales archaeon]
MILHIDDKYDRNNIYLFYKDHYEVINKDAYRYSFNRGNELKKIWKRMEIVDLIRVPDGEFEKSLTPKTRFINDNRMYPEYRLSNLTSMSFDIETYNLEGFPDPDKDRIVSIAYVYEGNVEVIAEDDEQDTITSFLNAVRAYDPDIIVGYNLERFDLPYVANRAKKLGIDFNIARYGLPTRDPINIPGRIVFDVYRLAILLSRFGILDLDDFSLSHVYYKIFGEKKFEIDKDMVWHLWENDRDKLLEYNKGDAIATDRIYRRFLPLMLELSNLSRMYLQDLIRGYSSKIVDNLIVSEGYSKYIIPDIYQEHEDESYEGGYVKMPKPGLYENIAVLDFASMYPSIIIANNIDYYTHLGDKDFLSEPLGLIPTTLKRIVDERMKIKNLIKQQQDRSLEIKSQALKIIANSFYGYMAYRRSRFYLKEAAEKVTEIGRNIILQVIDMAQSAGMEVIYADTDSIFIIYNTKDRVLEFVDMVNSTFPTMKMEIEGFYKRGIFVSKRSDDTGAKKKYALIREDGNIKIRGFELVRRDWCELARELQEEVLTRILRDGDVEGAVKRVRETIETLKYGKVDPQKLVIYTKLSKDIDDYKNVMPELVAAKKLMALGWDKRRLSGAVIKYIISTGSGNIASRAEPVEIFIKNNLKYDPDYYIDHQILPAVLKIMSSLGYDEQRLKSNLKQNRLI